MLIETVGAPPAPTAAFLSAVAESEVLTYRAVTCRDSGLIEAALAALPLSLPDARLQDLTEATLAGATTAPTSAIEWSNHGVGRSPSAATFSRLVPILRAVLGGDPYRGFAGVANRGLIDGLRAELVIEVPVAPG